MSGDKRYLLSKIPRGRGRALDLGGGDGSMRAPLSALGYAYLNLDLVPRGPSSVRADAHRLPIRSGSCDLVVSGDSLEHFPDPSAALAEVRRVATPDSRFVIWVPFLHPFHGDDVYRYTPLGLRGLLERAGFQIESIEAPLWVCSVIAQALVVPLQRIGARRLEGPIERTAAWLDARLQRFQGPDLSFAAAYLVVARPADG